MIDLMFSLSAVEVQFVLFKLNSRIFPKEQHASVLTVVWVHLLFEQLL